jgi:hypothetical protein
VRDHWDGSRREESSYYLLSSVGVELADMKPEVVPNPVRPVVSVVVLKRSNASGDKLHSNHGPRDAGLPEVADPWAERLQGLFGKGLACPGGELGGGHSGDEEELRFFEDVDEEPAAPKVFDFLHPLQINEVALCSGGGNEETQPELWFSPEDWREKRWRKYATDVLMPIHASQA